MFGDVPQKYNELSWTLLQNIFILSNKRGKEASGFAAVHNRPSSSLILDKRPISSPEFCLRSTKFKALRRDMPSIFIGHTRLSTSGDPKRGRNNHPFNNNRLSIVHNGSISEWKDVVKKEKLELRTETDSEIILRMIERRPTIEEGIQYLISNVNSSSRIAIAVLDRGLFGEKKPELNIFRNYSNDIWVATIASFRAMFFASEKSIIEDAIKGLWGKAAAAEQDKHHIKIQLLPTFRIARFFFDENGCPDCDKLITIKNNGPIKTHYSGQSYYDSGNQRTYPASPTKVTVTIKDDEKKEEKIPTPTTEILNNLREPIKEKALTLTARIEKSVSILNDIRSKPFMSHAEMEDFKRWMNRV